MTNDSLINVQSIAECSPWNILQYFWPGLSDYWPWKPICGLFESDCFTQVSLYMPWRIWIGGHAMETILKCDQFVLYRTFHYYRIYYVGMVHYSLQPVISTTPRKWFWWHFLLMLGIHDRNILWGMTKCPRVDATSETSN